MKTIIYLYLIGQLLAVNPPSNPSVPDVVGQFAQMEFDHGTLVYAHSYLAGTMFYDIAAGDIVHAIYSDGSLQSFEVVSSSIYIPRGTDEAATGANFEVRLDGIGEWLRLHDVLRNHIEADDLTLYTCFGANKGFGVTTGRLIVDLEPISRSK